MAANDNDLANAKRAADILRMHSQGIVILMPPPSTPEQKEAIDAIAQTLGQRRRRSALVRSVGGFAALVTAASAVAVLFAR